MSKWILVLPAVSLLPQGSEDPKKQQIERVDADAAVMGRVSAAVNEAIRNSADCSVAKPLLTEAYQRIDEARGRVQLTANQQLLQTMRIQVDRVAQICP